ncbi:MAG: winged helix-turn-helix transcriptional regulator, partial [Spirochaetia bacterium]|nr:winged helix-turn-helix transcriptional regulator [Spirochaetia bacterium]
LNHNRPLPPVTIESLNTEKRFDKRKYLNKELKDMFFALGLIESYGSGIRRAKESLKLNRSPELKFYPVNDIDDYTNAVMGISSEFLSNTDSETTTKTTTMQQKILEIISENPNLSVKDIASTLDLSVDGVRYHIKKMKKLGLIEYKGSSKSGQWILIDNN